MAHFHPARSTQARSSPARFSLTMRALLRVERELRVVRNRMCRPGGEVYLGEAVGRRLLAERLRIRLRG
jgi:hypothetical protein